MSFFISPEQEQFNQFKKLYSSNVIIKKVPVVDQDGNEEKGTKEKIFVSRDLTVANSKKNNNENISVEEKTLLDAMRYFATIYFTLEDMEKEIIRFDKGTKICFEITAENRFFFSLITPILLKENMNPSIEGNAFIITGPLVFIPKYIFSKILE
jgi:hypothetical protein